MGASKNEIANLMEQHKTLDVTVKTLQKDSLNATIKGATGVNNMEQWFARYGEPSRKAPEHNPKCRPNDPIMLAGLGEKYRTVPRPPKWRPHDEPSDVRVLRLGSAIWNEVPRGTWVFNKKD